MGVVEWTEIRLTLVLAQEKSDLERELSKISDRSVSLSEIKLNQESFITITNYNIHCDSWVKSLNFGPPILWNN